VALRAASNVGTFQPYLAAALLPASSQIHAAGQRERLQAVYRKSTRYLFLAGIPPFVYLAVYSGTVMTAWLGEPNSAAALILICLVPGYLVNSLSNGMAFVCQGMGRPDIQARQSALQLGLNVILSLTLFHLIGPIGAPVGTSISLILGAAYFAWRFHPHLGIATISLLRETALVPLGSSLLGVLAAWLLTGHMSELGRADALLKTGASFAVFAAVVTGFCLIVRYVGLSELRLIVSALRSHKERVLS
jgi:O-antigen/teichoic acid export membrane protein